MFSPAEALRKQQRTTQALGLASTLLIGLNLRPAITSVAATLTQAQLALELSSLEATVLATLPVIAFGLSAPIGPWLTRRFSVSWVLFGSMCALTVGLILRVLWLPLLFPGTLLAAMAIMAGGTLLPQFLKSLNASGLWVGLSSMTFGVGAALGAGFVSPLYVAAGDRIDVAWGMWALLAALAAVPLLLGILRMRAAGGESRVQRIPLVYSRASSVTMALLTLVFGVQALLYFAMTSWMPLLLAERGYSVAEIGSLLAWFSIAGFVPTLLTPILARKKAILLWLGPGLGVAIAAGMVWLLIAPDEQVFSAVAALGAVQTAAFGLAISLIVTMSTNPSTVGVVSAVSQGAGYIVAGAGSLGLGLLHTITGSWTPSFLVMSALGIVLSLIIAVTIRRQSVDLVSAPRLQLDRVALLGAI